MKLLFAITLSFAGVMFAQPKSYVDELRSYDGKSYLEVTCSKLICQAHEQISKSKVDCAAKDIWNGCGGKLEEVTSAASLADLDWSKVNGGDVLAVNGVHVGAFLGGGQGIALDPVQGGVGGGSGRALVIRTNATWFSG